MASNLPCVRRRHKHRGRAQSRSRVLDSARYGSLTSMTCRVTCAGTITALYTRVLFRTPVAALLLCAALFGGRGTTAVASAQAARGGTGKLEGKVRLVMPPVTIVPSGVYPSRRVSRPGPKTSEIANVIVFIKDAPRHGELPVQHATIMQKDEAFVPRVVAITTGSTIDFPNGDPFFHNVFSLSRGASFDLGRFPRGETRSRKFTTPGLVKVYCHIHSHMTASIMVFDHPYFRIPSADGTFSIDDVPAGTYQVSAWHERIGESPTSVKIEAGRTAKVEFAVPVEQR
jgi:plastocyanin